MKTVCIIQARMNSTRLPGKALKTIAGKPVLAHLIERVKRCRLIDKIVLATTDNSEDDAIERVGKKTGIEVFRGSPNDVLDRYYKCAKKIGADVIVRITGDCPLIDPEITDKTIGYFLKNSFDYVSNAYPKATYPDGLDTEVFSFKALEKTWQKAALPSEREHVTSHMWSNKNGSFALGRVVCEEDLSGKRWTVDTEADLKFVERVYDGLYFENNSFTMKDVLRLLKEYPDIEKINRGITRNEGYSRSLKMDGCREKKT